MYDVIVVGGGAAGLSGALALVRSRRSVLVVDQGEPRNKPADGVHNYLTRDGLPPTELTALGRDEVRGYGGEVLTGEVTAARATDGPETGFEVELADGRSFAARRLLVTTGTVDELPDVAGLAERFGHDVLHCPYCHGWEVRDQAIGVLQTSVMAQHQVLLFRQLSETVTLFLHDGPEPTEEQWERLSARGVSVVRGRVEGLEVTGDRLTGVRLHGGKVVATDALTVQTTLRARAGFLDDLGLKAGEVEMMGVRVGTAIEVDARGKTSVPGVWAAGNVAEPMAQVLGSAAAGLNAGAGLNAELAEEDTERAVAARTR